MHHLLRPLQLAAMQPGQALRTHRFHFEDWVPVALKSRGRIGKSEVNFTHMTFHRPATHRACFVSDARPPTAIVDSRNIEHATFDQNKTAGNTIKLAVLNPPWAGCSSQRLPSTAPPV